MKIGELESSLTILQPGRTRGEENPKGLDFQKILQEAQTQAQARQGIIPPQETARLSHGSVQDPLAIQTQHFEINWGTIRTVENQAIQTLDRTLLNLEKYQQSLADSQVSLKKIFPLIQSLQGGVQEINETAGKLSANDPLKGLLAEASILATVEVEKYNRGDYLS